MTSACCVKAVFVGLHVVFPIFPLVNVGDAEFPALLLPFDAGEEALSLFFVREVEEYLDGLGAIAMKMLFQINDGVKSLLPDVLLVAQLLGESLAAENVRMHANDQHLFVIRTVEDSDAAAFRKLAYCAPQEIVLQFLGARLLETDNFTTCWIDP